MALFGFPYTCALRNDIEPYISPSLASRDNDIGAEILPELTADDLIGLGVTSIGHRRKLLAAIAALREAAAAAPAPAPLPTEAVAVPAITRPFAARCHRDLRRSTA